jgi:UDP-N-acetylmuramoyl-tripeptide--D-alanyl-D-alanine ligase
MILTRDFFQKIVPNVTWIGSSEPCFDHAVIDSRSAQKKSAFFALQGEKVDAHDFLLDAYHHGARTFVLEKAKQEKIKIFTNSMLQECSIALVDNVRDVLVMLATAWRQQFTFPVIGVTGSVGKTSTKEMLVSVVRSSGKQYVATEGTRNTLVSIAACLLGLKPEHQCAIIEMGINKQGEMARLAHLVRPTLGIITAVAHSHMEGLGSLQDIATEKRDIFKYFKEGDIGIINGDQPILAAISYQHPVVKFGLKTTNQVQARKIQASNGALSCILKLYNKKYQCMLPTMHTGRLLNALACAAAAHVLGIADAAILKGIQEAPIIPGRFELKKLRTCKGIVVNDCYNANPESMREALFAFDRMETRGKKIAVLGDMLELGVNTPFWHRQIGRILRKTPSLAYVIFVGNHMKAAEKTIPIGIPFKSVSNWQEAIGEVQQHLEDEVAVLVKASNGVGLKNVVEMIVE